MVKGEGRGKEEEGIRKKEHKVRIFQQEALGLKTVIWQHAVL